MAIRADCARNLFGTPLVLPAPVKRARGAPTDAGRDAKRALFDKQDRSQARRGARSVSSSIDERPHAAQLDDSRDGGGIVSVRVVVNKPAHAGLILTTLILAAAVANLNLSVANVALPSIGKVLDAGQSGLNLVAVGFSLGLAGTVLYLGALGDRGGIIVFGSLMGAMYIGQLFAKRAGVFGSSGRTGNFSCSGTHGLIRPQFSSTRGSARLSFRLSRRFYVQPSRIPDNAHFLGCRKFLLASGHRLRVYRNWGRACRPASILFSDPIGAALVFFLFPKKDREAELLASYARNDR